MKREDLLRPGEYVALPRALATNRNLTGEAKVIWAIIANHLGENEVAWPGHHALALAAGCAVSTVAKCLPELAAEGWVKAEYRPGRSSLYTLIYPTENRCASTNPTENRRTENQCASAPKISAHPTENQCASAPKIGDELLNRKTEGTTQEKDTKEPATPATGPAAPAGPVDPLAVESGEGKAIQVQTAQEVIPLAGKDQERRKSKLSKAAKGEKTAALTDAEKAWIVKDASTIGLWLLYGRSAIGWTTGQPLPPPGRNHWSPATNSPEPDAGAHEQALTAWTWWAISNLRQSLGMPQTMPQWPKLAATVKRVAATMTRNQFVAVVKTACGRWREIVATLGSYGATLIPDETSWAASAVWGAASKLASGQPLPPRPTYQPATATTPQTDRMSQVQEVLAAARKQMTPTGEHHVEHKTA